LTIPNDPENRWWVETAAANQEFVASLKPSLVAFLGFSRDRIPQIAGTGFIISGDSEKALVLSAKHVFTEGISRIQRPHPIHAPSAVFLGSHHVAPSLDSRKMCALWINGSTGRMLNGVHAFYNDSLDISGCLLIPQENESLTGSISIPLDIYVPKIGDSVHMVSLSGLDAKETHPPQDASGKGQLITISERVSLRAGVVTGVYPDGFRQFRWPCFTTSIPALAGMSGGFVTCLRDNNTIAACGIVSADCSTPESHNDHRLCGESVIACSWPALALQISQVIPQPKDMPLVSLLEMMKKGNIHKAIGDIERVKIEQIEDGHFTIKLSV